MAVSRSVVIRCFALKKYCCGGTPVSNMPDNEDPMAVLGDSEIARVQLSVADAIPAVDHRLEDGAEVPSVVA